MNKADLINALAEQTSITKKEAEKAVSGMISLICDALRQGDKVQIMGFGSFEVKERAARTAVNPSTKAKMDIPASKTVAFKAGKALRIPCSKPFAAAADGNSRKGKCINTAQPVLKAAPYYCL